MQQSPSLPHSVDTSSNMSMYTSLASGTSPILPPQVEVRDLGQSAAPSSPKSLRRIAPLSGVEEKRAIASLSKQEQIELLNMELRYMLQMKYIVEKHKQSLRLEEVTLNNIIEEKHKACRARVGYSSPTHESTDSLMPTISTADQHVEEDGSEVKNLNDTSAMATLDLNPRTYRPLNVDIDEEFDSDDDMHQRKRVHINDNNRDDDYSDDGDDDDDDDDDDDEELVEV